jgi:hypothetical protein
MVRFAEVFPEGKIVSTLLRELPWIYFIAQKRLLKRSFSSAGHHSICF